MAKKKYIAWLAGAALMASLGSCIDDTEGIQPAGVQQHGTEKYSTILLNVMPPEGVALTRGDVDEIGVDALENEGRMYSMKVWAFVSEGQSARTVHYTYVDENGDESAADKTTQTPDALNLDTNSPVAYVEYENAIGTVDLQQLELSIPSVILENFLKLDIYATCNSQEYLAKTDVNPVGEITSHATRQQIEAAVLKHDTAQDEAKRQDPFGLTTLVRGPQQEGFVGLPMSYIQKNVDFYDEVNQTSVIKYDYLENSFYFDKDYVHPITLKRVVSKFRFVFTRSQGTVQGAQINKIEVGLLDGDNVVGGASPNAVYQLPNVGADGLPTNEAHIASADYDDRHITYGDESSVLLDTDDIMVTQDVYQYMYQDGMSAQEYDNLLLGKSYDVEVSGSSKEGKELTMFGRTYLRETDKKLGGKITYTINAGTDDAQQKTATFEMAEAGDFARNHLWIIYAYFEGGGLYVKPSILPWIHNEATDYYEMETGSDVSIEVYKNETLSVDGSWLKYTDLTDSDETQNTYIAVTFSQNVADGFSRNPADHPEGEDITSGYPFTGNPLTMTTNSPLMHMKFKSSRYLYVSRFAPHFLFLWVPAGASCYDGEGNLVSVPESGWKVSDHIDNLNKDKEGDIFFYVIPDRTFTPGVEARENTIVVSELGTESDRLMPGNVAINQNFSLPGMLYTLRFKYVISYEETEVENEYKIEKVEN